MTKQNHKTGFLVAAMIFSAIFLRVLGKFDILIVPGGIVRSLIYIALYIGWGISVSKRIIQTQVRHYKVNNPHPCDTEKQRMAQGKWRLLCTGRPSFLLLRLSQKGEKPCE